MLQNIYTLPDLIDLALIIPEVGAVNFNILHTILHTIVKELKIEDVRPLCHIENPLLAKTALMKAKLKEAAQRRESTLPESVGIIFAGGKPTTPLKTEDREILEGRKDTSLLSTKRDVSSKISEKLHTEPAAEEQLSTPPDTATQTGDVETTDPGPLTTETKDPLSTQAHPQKEIKPEPKITETESARHKADDQFEVATKKETLPKSYKRQHKTEDSWKYVNLEKRMIGAEESLQTVTELVDYLLNQKKKADKRRKEGGPSSEELEAIDERLLELEEALERYAADHDLLMEIDKNLKDILKEFEAIKALAALLEQMQLDISMKADKEETWAALALKGDLELVNTKVDQLEFETAIEELGEAIGLLGLKFTRKNDEWEERAAEIWRGIDSKMSRDIFEAAKVKIESRLTALMYGLRKLKKVVEELLYPESAGVTRCILCRRPACISGLECLEFCDSPKRRLPDKSSGDEDSDNLRKAINVAIAKRQKMEEPPYPKTRDTIITIPYSSSSYRSCLDEKQEKEVSQIKLMPIVPNRNTASVKKASQIPKLPEINGSNSSLRTPKKKPKEIMLRSGSKSRNQKSDLVFTRKMLARFHRTESESSPPQQYGYTVVLEADAPKKASHRQMSEESLKSIDLTPDPEKCLDSFTPPRRDILVSPTAPSEHAIDMSLSPLQFETKSNKYFKNQETELSGSFMTSSDESEISTDDKSVVSDT